MEDDYMSLQEASEELKERRNVTFSDVEIRLYERVLGDNPNTDMPLSLGWRFNVCKPLSVDEYTERHNAPDYVGGKNLEPTEMRERERILLKSGYSRSMLYQEERRRRVQLGLEWGYRCNRMEMTTCNFPNAQTFIKRYIA